MSSKILRRAVLTGEPLLIDNTQFFPEQGPELAAELPELVEALQQEHPDAGRDLIEDAVNDAIEQLLVEEGTESSGYGIQMPDSALQERELDFSALDEGLQKYETDSGIEIQESAPTIELPASEANPEEILSEARRTADELMENARREAAEVLREADARAAEIERAAYEKGYEEGLAEGKSAGDEQATRELGQVAAIVEEASQLHDEMLHEAESEMVALSLEIARKIIQAEVRTNPEIVTKVLAAAVQRINGSPRVTIKVNPSELEGVQRHWAKAYGPNYREKQWAIQGDERVAVGGCVLETRYGSLDAQISSQFTEIQKAFALLLGTES